MGRSRDHDRRHTPQHVPLDLLRAAAELGEAAGDVIGPDHLALPSCGENPALANSLVCFLGLHD